MKKIFLIAILLSAINSCEPLEVEINDKFNFTVEADSDSSIKVNTELPITIKIVPERVITETTYNFSYQNSLGQGILYHQGNRLETNQEYSINIQANDFSFISETIGDHKIALTFIDSNENTKEVDLSFNVFDDNDFNFIAETDSLSIFHKDEMLFDFNLEKIDNGSVEVITYDLVYENKDLETTFLFNDTEYRSGELIQNISFGNFTGLLKSNEIGKSVLSFTIIPSIGNPKSITKEVEFKANDFDFTFETSTPTNMVGRQMSVLFGIDQHYEENLSYTVNILGQQGEIVWGGLQNLPGTLNNFFPGNFNLTYYPSAVSNNDFVVSVTASNGVQKRQRVSFEALPVDFDFETSKGTLNLTQTLLNGFIGITLQRPTDLAQRESKYYLTISSNIGSIFVTHGNSNISLGEIIELNRFSGIQNEFFNYGFQFTDSVTDGEIRFTVRNETGFEVSKTVEVKVEN